MRPLRPVISNKIRKGGVLSEETIVRQSNVARVDVYEGVTNGSGTWTYNFPTPYEDQNVFAIAQYAELPPASWALPYIAYSTSSITITARRYNTTTVGDTPLCRATVTGIPGITVRALVYVLQDSFIS